MDGTHVHLHSHTRALTRALALALTRAFALALTRAFALALTRALTRTLAHMRTYTCTCTRTYTCTHAHSKKNHGAQIAGGPSRDVDKARGRKAHQGTLQLWDTSRGSHTGRSKAGTPPMGAPHGGH